MSRSPENLCKVSRYWHPWRAKSSNLANKEHFWHSVVIHVFQHHSEDWYVTVKAMTCKYNFFPSRDVLTICGVRLNSFLTKSRKRSHLLMLIWGDKPKTMTLSFSSTQRWSSAATPATAPIGRELTEFKFYREFDYKSAILEPCAVLTCACAGRYALIVVNICDVYTFSI